MGNQVLFYKEHNKKETGHVNLENCVVANFREQNIRTCPMGMVVDAIHIVAAAWDLNPTRRQDFKVIKRIVINSVLNN